MRLLPKSRAQAYLFLFVVIALPISCISPPYPTYLALQHVPTAAALVALVAANQTGGISTTSYAFFVAFLILHVLGARYLYSYVPYDLWSTQLFGADITATFSFTRNHYDRLVHLFYGLLIAVPAFRAARRFAGVTPVSAALFAVQFILATSALYELAEWLLAVTLAPDWAREYNGQQGDWWDPHKDMSLALLGALFSTTVLLLRSTARRHALDTTAAGSLTPPRTEDPFAAAENANLRRPLSPAPSPCDPSHPVPPPAPHSLGDPAVAAESQPAAPRSTTARR